MFSILQRLPKNSNGVWAYIRPSLKNALTDKSAALSSAFFHRIPSRSSCYMCGFWIKLPNKLLAACSVIGFLAMPIKIVYHKNAGNAIGFMIKLDFGDSKKDFPERESP